ncbi:MAG: YIP1 family protein [Acidobacteriaceae bacterium]
MDEIGVGGTEQRGLSQVERVINTFVAPSAAFQDILRSTSWWLPFVLLSLSALGVAFTIQRHVGWQQVVQTQIQMNPSQQSQMALLTPAQQATQIHGMVLGYQIAAYASPLLVLAISALAALLFWASFNFGLGARTTYGQIFCLWMYCSLPHLLVDLVTVVRLCFGGNAESFDLKVPAGTSLGYYFPDASPWLRTLLNSLDLAAIWALVLLVIGGAIVAKVKKSQAAAVVVGWWLLIVLVGVAATAAFS